MTEHLPREATRTTVTVGGLRLSAIVHEPAPDRAVPGAAPFLLVHGLASNARLWDGVGAALAAAGHRSIAIDLRGHGRSEKPEDGYDFATVTADLAAAIGELGLERPIVAGQSWGGNVVIELAARHPELVRGVVAVDGGMIALRTIFPDWDSCREALSPPMLVGTPLVQMEAWIRSAHPHWPEGAIDGTMQNFERRPDGTIAPWLTRERHITILRALWEHVPGERYPAIRVPVLLLPAERPEDGSPLARARATWMDEAERLIPACRVRWFRPADHDVHAEQPDAVAAVMLGALADGFFPA